MRKKEKEYLIPKSFELGGVTYRVEKTNEIRGSIFGYIQPFKGTVTIADKLEQNGELITLTEEMKLLTMYHELTHLIFHHMGETELFGDEKIVELFSNFLLQYEKSKKY